METFAVSGLTKDKDELIKCIEFILDIRNNGKAPETYKISTLSNNHTEVIGKGAPILYFSSYKKGDGRQKYPFTATPIAMAEHIVEFIDTMWIDKLELHNEAPSDCADYDIGWELFIPDWRIPKYDTKDSEHSIIFAVRPKLIEYEDC